MRYPSTVRVPLQWQAIVGVLMAASLVAEPVSAQHRRAPVSDGLAAAEWRGPSVLRVRPELDASGTVRSEDPGDTLAPMSSGERMQQMPEISRGKMFGGALVGGLVGAAAGAGLGFVFADDVGCGDEWCVLGGTVVGGLVGESVGMPVGAHLVNRRRGDLFRGIIMTTLVGGAGLGLASIFDSGAGATLALTAFAQAFVAAAIEDSSTPDQP